jgi:hypothetical protein
LIQANVGSVAVPTWKTPLAVALMLKTVMLTENATALDGTPQGAPESTTAREMPLGSGVELRESYCRQGVIAMKGRGAEVELTACVRAAPGTLAAGGVQ